MPRTKSHRCARTPMNVWIYANEKNVASFTRFTRQSIMEQKWVPVLPHLCQSVEIIHYCTTHSNIGCRSRPSIAKTNGTFVQINKMRLWGYVHSFAPVWQVRKSLINLVVNSDDISSSLGPDIDVHAQGIQSAPIAKMSRPQCVNERMRIRLNVLVYVVAPCRIIKFQYFV